MIRLKEISYKIFSFHYWLGKQYPIKKNSVFSVMTHDESDTGNIMALVNYMRTKGAYSFVFYTGKNKKAGFGEKWKSAMDLLFVKPFQMARAEFILMDNAFLPMAFLCVRKESIVVQLWHGTGSTKKFGQDSNVGRLKELEKKLNQNIDYLTINAGSQKTQYAGAFGIEEEKCVVTGLPRTDWLLRFQVDSEREKRKRQILEKIEGYLGCSLEGKKILLYAPTFRDDELVSSSLHLNIDCLMKELPEEIVLFLRLHPFVAKNFCQEKKDRIYHMSFYSDLNELMAVSNALITDYSSLIFDYAVLNQPMFFCADDCEKFETMGRGFYLDFKKDLPGITTDNEEDLSHEIQKALYEKEAPLLKEKREAFLQKYYDYLDGYSAKRVYECCIDTRF